MAGIICILVLSIFLVQFNQSNCFVFGVARFVSMKRPCQTADHSTYAITDNTNKESIVGMTMKLDQLRENLSLTNEKIVTAKSEYEQLNADYGGEIDRLRKEFTRIRERANEEYANIVNNSKIDTVKGVLPTLDNFARAQQAYQPIVSINERAMMEYYDPIFNELSELVNSYGVTKVVSIGQLFDVNLMEALQSSPSVLPEGTVIHEYQPGYRMGSRCIIPALVVVSSGTA